MSRVLSGMRPTGSGNLHLGNYTGAVQQFLTLQEANHDCFYFVADLHAYTETQGSIDTDALSVGVVKNYLACGVDPNQVTLYRQSDVPEIPYIALLLGMTASLTDLRRCTTYKGKCEKAKAKRRDELGRDLNADEVHQIENAFSIGLLNYPILMAADILCVRADRVPVGEDQVQHVEYARDYAALFNRMFNTPVFVVPQLNVTNPMRVPGIDGGGKMGKSEGNAVDLLDDANTIRRKILGIPTQSDTVGEKTAGTQALFTLYELYGNPDKHTEYLQRYGQAGGKFFGDMKRELADAIIQLTAPIQARFAQLKDDDVRQVLEQGAQKVRPIAAQVLCDMQVAMGLRRREV